MKTLKEIQKLYYILLGQELLLKKELVDLFYDIGYTNGPNSKILANQEEEESNRDEQHKNRFFRNTERTELFVLDPNNIPDLYKFRPLLPPFLEQLYQLNSDQLSIAEKEKLYKRLALDYDKLSMSEKENLEMLLYQRLAIVHARRANVTNRNKYTHLYSMTRKDIEMQYFIEYAIKYNNLAAHEDKIAFGFTKDSNGAVLLDASLPGYTRLSVHFGYYSNFYQILTSINNNFSSNAQTPPFKTYIDRDGSIKIDQTVFTDYSYNLPTFGVINTGIINRDDYNKASMYEQTFAEKCKDTIGKINVLGIEEFIYILYPELNDRETFYIAEKAGAGQGILDELKIRLNEREEKNKTASSNKRNLQEEYLFSLDDQKLFVLFNDILNSEQDTLISLINSIIIKSDNFDKNNCIYLLNKARKLGFAEQLWIAIKTELSLNEIPLSRIVSLFSV